ncbi:kinase-like domain-containing protein [Roridomyces roridus]|uniref:non-specific serine/threonine protein kinase n=1 Tax=Roridomyces roridus TaxID=1738132 RepID=A0AAD7FWF5_9AGAR|nr:kinase-like domain-containing protein [Roridomyces roridus]
MAAYSRPLPTPPTGPRGSPFESYRGGQLDYRPDGYPPSFAPYAYPQTPQSPTTLPGGTLLHKGFYDLLSMIPTPSPSRLMWGPPPEEEPGLAGPRYEHIRPAAPPARGPPAGHAYPPSSPPVPRKTRRISKDMVSRPTGFVHLVHASDADQFEALLSRWGPDGMGKLGDPHWANPIKDRVRQTNQARAVNEVVNALKPSQGNNWGDQVMGPLRVVNGLSTTTTTSSTLTTAARENFLTSAPEGFPGRPGNSTIRWGGGLQVHAEDDEHLLESSEPPVEQPPLRKPITPSLATLEKAVAARIYFENLYFPLFRHPPSREQRRLAMERDMGEMQLNQMQKENLRARWLQNETDYLRDRRRRIDATAFRKLKTIGHGAFGVVSLVREQSTGQLYAMKQLRKTDMLRKGQEGHVRAERDILKSAALVNSPGGAEWIVRMYYSFQDRDNLYLVLEYMGGGDLLNLLIERDVFDESFTRFYVAEMILAIESCHKHGFIHRDIKPDNFLFDPTGHIKLSDFGLATDLHWAHDTSYYEQQRLHLLHKHGIDLEDTNGIANGRRTKRMNRQEVELLMGGGDGPGGVFTWREKNRRKLAYSVCGTNSYMSPEVIRGHGYSYSCDWWSLGVIMYECLYGGPPFASDSRHITRQKILNWKQALKFPGRRQVSHEGVNLMQQLLCEPEDRLGSQASVSVSRPNSMVMHSRRSGFMAQNGSSDGANLIKAHPWFRGIDWLNIHRYPAPYHPELRAPEDTRHFDPDIPPETLAPANGAAPDATRDPLLRHEVHGAEIMDVRKALAFAGFTHKSPRVISYVRADKAFDSQPDSYGQTSPEPSYGYEEQGTIRGRTAMRVPQDVGKGRAISM